MAHSEMDLNLFKIINRIFRGYEISSLKSIEKDTKYYEILLRYKYSDFDLHRKILGCIVNDNTTLLITDITSYLCIIFDGLDFEESQHLIEKIEIKYNHYPIDYNEIVNINVYLKSLDKRTSISFPNPYPVKIDVFSNKLLDRLITKCYNFLYPNSRKCLNNIEIVFNSEVYISYCFSEEFSKNYNLSEIKETYNLISQAKDDLKNKLNEIKKKIIDKELNCLRSFINR